nr:MAG TPA: Reverse gyrase zinc finger [Caudoviricetes sp.]
MEEKKTKKNEKKFAEVSATFQRPITFTTLVPAIPKFKGSCPNC